MLTETQLQISILCADIHQAKQLRDILKKQSVLCYVYTDFEEFWQQLSHNPAELFLLDITMTSQGQRGIEDHPKYQARQMDIVFYCDQHSLPLLDTVYKLHSLGHFNLDSPHLEQELSLIIGAWKTQRTTAQRAQKLQAELHRTLRQRDQVIQSSRQYVQKIDYLQLLGDIVSRIEQAGRDQDFLSALDQVLGQLKVVEEYALLESTADGQKLVSPQLSGRKYRMFPSLWLGRDHGSRGIAPYAQGLGHQTATDHLGEQVVAMGLRVRAKDPPQLMVYLKVRPEVVEQLDWKLLQSFLSGCYARSLVNTPGRTQTPGHLIGSWEFFDLLRDGSRGGYGIWVLEFQQLLEAMAKKSADDFQWKRCYQEFTTLLEQKIHHDYFATCLGRWAMAFFVSDDHGKSFELNLAEFSRKFAYWRFFDDPDQILAAPLAPELRGLDPDRREFFRYLAQRGREDANRYLVQNRMHEPAATFKQSPEGRPLEF